MNCASKSRRETNPFEYFGHSEFDQQTGRRVEVKFTKMSGAGNDFVLIDNRTGSIRNAAEFAVVACNRRRGIGADGLLLLEASTRADYRMMYFNADGSYGGMCGNGGRCIAKYAIQEGLAGSRHAFEALGQIYTAEREGELVRLSMKNPIGIKQNIRISVGGKSVRCHYVDTGSPHVVVLMRDLKKQLLEKVHLEKIGPEIRHHRRFQPLGANVNIVEVLDTNMLAIRTYERGVEAETMACGTGSVASAVIASLLGLVSPPVTIVPKSNSRLIVDFKRMEQGFEWVTLTGSAVVTFSGKFDA